MAVYDVNKMGLELDFDVDDVDSMDLLMLKLINMGSIMDVDPMGLF